MLKKKNGANVVVRVLSPRQCSSIPALCHTWVKHRLEAEFIVVSSPCFAPRSVFFSDFSGFPPS